MTIRSKQIPILVRPTWLHKAGMSKGLNHDRQHLGIILADGQTIKARQTNNTFKASLNLRFLNDDRKTESSNKIGSSWASVSANAVYVPFIDTSYYDRPEDNVEPVVEYDFPGESKNLPVYRLGDDETALLKAWDDADVEFALVNSRYTMILIPARDKDVVKNLPGVENIDGLIGYYESVFSFFNSLAGLSFQPDHESDLIVPNRYFMKADIYGPGGGYYSASYTAGSTNSLKKWWLSPRPTSWENLHEIAHGYQAYFWKGEVSNNIYAACFQIAMLGDRKCKEGWQYDGGKQERVEKSIIGDITAKKPLDKWDFRANLYFVMMMLDKAGWNAFADFNKQYRRSASKAGFQVPEHLFFDDLSESRALLILWKGSNC